MARKLIIENLMKLAQSIGANPNKFMGTKQNINFLGTGDRGMKGTTFSGAINDDFLNLGFGRNDLIKIIEQDMGYVTAGKLNDVQLKTMENNLNMINKTFNPPPGPKNVIDLETGTGALNKEGLESLRDTDKIQRFTKGLRTSKTAMTDKIKEGINSLKTKLTRDYGGDEIATKATAERNFKRMGAADWSDSIAAEGARRAVVREAIKNNPQVFNLPPEMVESIVLSKDLGKGGSKFADPLVVFRNIGQFTNDELAKIDDIIERSPFDEPKFISEKVMEYITDIRPEGFKPMFAEGGRIGYSRGRSVKGILDILKLTNKKFGKDTLKVADEIERPASAKLRDEFAAFNERTSVDKGAFSKANIEDALGLKQYGGIENAKIPVEMMTTEVIMAKYPGITERLAKLIGEDTNLQRKAEALAELDQALALTGSGKSADEVIEILKREPTTKMSKGGLARILEM